MKTVRIVPVVSIWDKVYCKQMVQRSWFKSWYCSHPTVAEYDRIDYRGGPGGYADNYTGGCCVCCGKIMYEKKTL